MTRTDRRGFLSALATLSLTSMAPALARPAKRIVVVGAGITGLYSAWRLEQGGWEVEVIESAARIGGRNFTLRDGELFTDRTESVQPVTLPSGSTFDAGPWRVLPAHRQVRALAAALALDLEPVNFAGHEGSDRIAGGMDGLPRALAARLRAPVQLRTALVAARSGGKGVRPEGKGLRLWVRTPTAEIEWQTDAVLFTALPGRLFAIDHDLPALQASLRQIQQRDALKIALTAGQAAPIPLPASSGMQALTPRRYPGLAVLYGNQMALDGALRGGREQQIRNAQRLWGSPTENPLLVRFADLPGIGAAAEHLPAALRHRLAAGLPPWFFASDALSALNGWQEGALISAQRAVRQIERHFD